jgi:hypothetical protein
VWTEDTKAIQGITIPTQPGTSNKADDVCWYGNRPGRPVDGRQDAQEENLSMTVITPFEPTWRLARLICVVVTTAGLLGSTLFVGSPVLAATSPAGMIGVHIFGWGFSSPQDVKSDGTHVWVANTAGNAYFRVNGPPVSRELGHPEDGSDGVVT